MRLLIVLAFALCAVVALSQPRQDLPDMAREQIHIGSLSFYRRALKGEGTKNVALTSPASPARQLINRKLPGKYEKLGKKVVGTAGAVCCAAAATAAAVAGSRMVLDKTGAGGSKPYLATDAILASAAVGAGVGNHFAGKKGAQWGKKLDDRLAQGQGYNPMSRQNSGGDVEMGRQNSGR